MYVWYETRMKLLYCMETSTYMSEYSRFSQTYASSATLDSDADLEEYSKEQLVLIDFDNSEDKGSLKTFD